MKEFLKIAGIVILQFIVGVVLLLLVLWFCTSAKVHYAGDHNYEQLMQKADTPAELKGGAK